GSFAAPNAPAPGKTEFPRAGPAPGVALGPGLAQGSRTRAAVPALPLQLAHGPWTGSSLPVLPALRGLLPRGGLARGSVVAVAEFGLLCLALAAAASAGGGGGGDAGRHS